MTGRVRVKPADEFDDPGRAIVDVDGTEVGVIRLDGEYFALENRCAHQGGPVCSGEVTNELVAEPPEPGSLAEASFTGEKTIACPWHGYTYGLATGEHVGDDRLRLRTFDVVVEDGVVYVEG